MKSKLQKQGKPSNKQFTTLLTSFFFFLCLLGDGKLADALVDLGEVLEAVRAVTVAVASTGRGAHRAASCARRASACRDEVVANDVHHANINGSERVHNARAAKGVTCIVAAAGPVLGIGTRHRVVGLEIRGACIDGEINAGGGRCKRAHARGSKSVGKEKKVRFFFFPKKCRTNLHHGKFTRNIFGINLILRTHRKRS